MPNRPGCMGPCTQQEGGGKNTHPKAETDGDMYPTHRGGRKGLTPNRQKWTETHIYHGEADGGGHIPTGKDRW